MRITQHMNTNAFIHVKLLQHEGLLETWPPKWSILCYKIKLHPLGSEKNVYCPHLKCGDNYMPHYSSCVISGHIQHLAQRQFRVCLKQRQSRKRHGGHIPGSKVTGTVYGTSWLAFSWDDATAISNVLCVGGPTSTCFLGKGEERKMGKGNQVKYAKISEEEEGRVCAWMCVCLCVHARAPACVRPAKSGSHALAWEDLGVRGY